MTSLTGILMVDVRLRGRVFVISIIIVTEVHIDIVMVVTVVLGLHVIWRYVIVR